MMPTFTMDSTPYSAVKKQIVTTVQHADLFADVDDERNSRSSDGSIVQDEYYRKDIINPSNSNERISMIRQTNTVHTPTTDRNGQKLAQPQTQQSGVLYIIAHECFLLMIDDEVHHQLL